jgi:hypothetical protein
MQNVEDFMREFLSAGIELTKRELEMRVPYRNRFYSDDCHFDSRKFTLAFAQSERIVEIQKDAADVRVICRKVAETPRRAAEMLLRYHLHPFNTEWRIHKVDVACMGCIGKDPNCPLCGGNYWGDTQ